MPNITTNHAITYTNSKESYWKKILFKNDYVNDRCVLSFSQNVLIDCAFFMSCEELWCYNSKKRKVHFIKYEFHTLKISLTNIRSVQPPKWSLPWNDPQIDPEMILTPKWSPVNSWNGTCILSRNYYKSVAAFTFLNLV